MSKSVHSVKLIPYDSVDLDRLSYSSGDIVYDVTNGTLRLMDGVTQGGSKIASQSYVTNSLAAYATNTSVNTAISTALSTALTGYATTASLSSYATTASLSSYALTSSLSSYALTSSLSSYALTSSLSSYALTSSLSSYLTTSTASTTYALKASPTFSGTITAPTAVIGGVNIKTFAIVMGAALA